MTVSHCCCCSFFRQHKMFSPEMLCVCVIRAPSRFLLSSLLDCRLVPRKILPSILSCASNSFRTCYLSLYGIVSFIYFSAIIIERGKKKSKTHSYTHTSSTYLNRRRDALRSTTSCRLIFLFCFSLHSFILIDAVPKWSVDTLTERTNSEYNVKSHLTGCSMTKITII